MARGISTAGDIVAASIDGADLEAMFREFQATLAIRNEERTAVANFLSFPTVRSADGVAQTTDQDGFERASEFGEPVSLAAPPDVVTMGYDFNDHDLATRFTARYLRDATAAEIEAIHRRALAADNKLVNTEILKRLLDPTPGENSDGKTVYGLWTGTDGMRPPHYAFRTFPANHSHYLTTGSATPDGADLDALISTIREHGYGTQAGSQLVLFLNPDELPPIVAIRAGSGTLQASTTTSPARPPRRTSPIRPSSGTSHRPRSGACRSAVRTVRCGLSRRTSCRRTTCWRWRRTDPTPTSILWASGSTRTPRTRVCAFSPVIRPNTR